MRRFINYLRSCFCKHDWECIVSNVEVYDRMLPSDRPYMRIWLYRCKKCGHTNKVKLDA